MKVLLDTNAFIYLALDNEQLSSNARSFLLPRANELILSAASHWKMAIKICLGKLKLNEPFAPVFERMNHELRLTPLAIELRHTSVVASLPFHHRDPFDRILVAQAIVEHLPLVSSDAQLDAYGIQRIW